MPTPGRGRAADDLVVDVGDVHDPRHAVAAPAQVADEQVGEQERAEVADVGRPVDGRAAGVDPDGRRLERLERRGSRRSACRRSRSVTRPSLERSRSPAREIARPAPSAPSRLPVDALTFTTPSSTPSRRGDRVAHRVEVRRRAAAARRRSSGRPWRAASRRRPTRRTTSRRSSRAGDPARRRRSGREEPAEVAEAGRAQERVGRWRGARRRRRSGRAAAARRRSTTPPSARPLAGAERMAVVADPGARCGRAGQRDAATRRRSAGQRHLEVAGIAGDDMDGDATGLQQRGLVGPGLGPVRREARVGRAQQPAPDALRGLGRRERRRGRRSPTTRPPSTPLEGLGDRHDRDRGAVRRRPPRRPRRRAPRVTSGRAPSWTRTTRSSRGSASRRALGDTRLRPILAPSPAGDDRDDARPAATRPRGSAVDPLRPRSTTTMRSTSGAAVDCGERPGEQRPAADVGA